MKENKTGLKFCNFAGMVLFCFSAAAATSQEDCTAYLEESDPNGSGISSFSSAARWSDGKVPGPGSTNYVGRGLTIRDAGGASVTNTFPGDVLVLGGTFYGMAGSSSYISWPELRMQNGSEYKWASFSHVSGKITIESDSSEPACFTMFYPGNINATILDASFCGGADSCFLLKRFSGNPLAPLPDLKWRIRGDWSGFYGTCRVCEKSQIHFYNKEHEIPGTIVVENGGYWWFNSGEARVTVGTLELQDGATYWGRCSSDGKSAVAVVTNKLVLGAVDIDFYNKWEYNGTAKSVLPKCTHPNTPVEIPLFKLVGAAAENVPDLTKATIPDYPAASKIGEFPRKKALACKDNGDGTKTICARYYSDGPIILMIKSNGSYKTAESAFNATGDDVAKYWNPAEVPTSETAGEVYAEKSITWTDSKTYSFPYLQFTIAPAANLYMQCTHLTVKKIMFGGDGGMQTYSRSGTVDGPIELSTNPSATNTVTVYQKCRLTINGDISGAANLKVTAPVPHHNPVGYTTFNGSHAGLRGAFMLTCSSHPEDTVNSSGTAIPAFPNLAKELYLQVYMNRGDQFGGRYEGGAAWRSIHVNNYGCINVVGDMTVDEPTRGFFVDGGVQFNVSDGKTLTLGIPVTYGGEMIKKGSGKLVLGGEARFVDGSSETLPQEGANVLAIDKGSLKVTATNALNGVCAKFAKGTELCLDAVPENADMAAYGIINTRWNVPFVCGEDDGAIRVRLENAEAAESLARFSCAICTVAAETAAALKFKVPRLRNFFCGIVRRENADGTVTVAAEYVRRGRLFIKMR